MSKYKFTGQLEVDADRGVIYFHSSVTGLTLLRICRLPKEQCQKVIDENTPAPTYGVSAMLDITHMYGSMVSG